MSNKKLLTEYYELCPNGYCEDLLTEQEKKEITEGALYLTGLMQCAGRKNGNGRVYKKDTLKREIDAYKNVVRDRRALGELDHPESSVVNLQNVSHMVVKIDMRGDEVHGKIKVLDTPSGKVFKALIDSDVKIGISSRGLGTVTESNGSTIVEDDFQLICFDVVLEPSTKGAFMEPPRRNYSRNIALAENKTNKLSKLDIASRVEDILGK